MSEGLKQKIQKEAKSYGQIDNEIQLLAIKSEKSVLVRYLPKEQFERRWVREDFILSLLSEVTKQIQELFDDTDSRAGDYRVISVVRGLKEEVLAILEGKEKANP